MALIIKGDMPKYGCANLVDCKLCDITQSCPAWKRYFGTERFNEECVNHFPSDCPILGEIPDEHGRLVDKSVIMDKIQALLKERSWMYASHAQEIIDIITDAPTVIEETK